MDLNLEDYEELFGVALSHSEELFENGGIDSLFGSKELSAGDSNCQDAIAAEVLNFRYPLSVIIMASLLLDAMFSILHTMMLLCVHKCAFVFFLIICFF